MVGFLFIQVFIHLRVATHSGWLKTPDLGQKEACNQGKEDFKQLTYSRMHSASSATGENVLQWEQLPFSKKMGKCALWGLRGRTPYKAHSTLCVSLLNLLRFLIRSRRSSFPPPRSSFVSVVERAGTKDYISNV